MEKKTYGAPRYMDWVAQIKVGAATIKVHFTGGALTVYGVTPAEYTTSNVFIQKAIEMSSYFKEGRILLLKSVELPSSKNESKALRQKKRKQGCDKHYSGATVEAEEIKKEQEDSVSEEMDEVGAECNEQCAGDDIAEGADAEQGEDTEGIVVEAACLQDAQDYLQQHFNIPSYKIRTYETAGKVALEHGIKFIGGKFSEEGNSSQDS